MKCNELDFQFQTQYLYIPKTMLFERQNYQDCDFAAATTKFRIYQDTKRRLRADKACANQPGERVPTQTSSRVTFLLLDTLTQRSDQMADVPDGNLEWEVDRGKHLSKKDPPACQSCEEAKGAGGNLQSLGHFCVPQCRVPVCAGQDDESEKQSEEDGHENEVCPQRADEIDQTQETHEE